MQLRKLTVDSTAILSHLAGTSKPELRLNPQIVHFTVRAEVREFMHITGEALWNSGSTSQQHSWVAFQAQQFMAQIGKDRKGFHMLQTGSVTCGPGIERS